MPATLPHRSSTPCVLISTLAVALGISVSSWSLADTPVSLVSSSAASYALREPKVFWHVASYCAPIPDSNEVDGWDTPEEVWRVASDGAGVERKIFSENEPRPENFCNPYEIPSAVIADDDYLYWVGPTGLVRLSVEANPGDTPELMAAGIRGSVSSGNIVQLAQSDTIVYAATSNGLQTRIWSVAKASFTTFSIRTLNSPRIHSLSHDGKYLFWIRGGELERLFIGRGFPLESIASDVTAYYAEGSFTRAFGGTTTEMVWFARGRRVYSYDNLTGVTSAAIYTSPVSDAVIRDIVATKGNFFGRPPAHLFFLEARTVPQGPDKFLIDDVLLMRASRNGNNPELLWTKRVDEASSIHDLKQNNLFIFWQDGGEILRLPVNAEAIPEVRLRARDLEVTQGIQNLSNDVFLVEGRRTFVRFHVSTVENDSPSVAGVSATLRGIRGRTFLGTLYPINEVGSQVRVRADPVRAELDHSFLFELPDSWTQSGLRLTATLNPNQVPFEDDYDDNTLTFGPATFLESPRFELHLVQMRYTLNGTFYSPRYRDDVLHLFSYLRRQFPLDSTPGFFQEPGPGLRPTHEIVYDSQLGSHVGQTHPFCILNYEEESRSLCASDYAKARLADWKISRGDAYRVYCAMMWDPEGFFPRGSARGLTCTTPTGPDDWGWDFDGSYGDWYGAHEIAHCLGRSHPSPASDDPSTPEVREGCRHSRSDPWYPYANAAISSFRQDAFGFDAGDAKTPRSVYPWSMRFDIMSYCGTHWISDYTYEGVYNNMRALDVLRGIGGVAGGEMLDDWLFVRGSILSSEDRAFLHFLRRHDEPVELPEPGTAYEARLLGAAGEVLESRIFDTEPVEEADVEREDFDIILPYADGARTLQLLTTSGEVLHETELSSNSPTIRSVSVDAVGSPVRGDVSLSWTANDPDGDELLADISWMPSAGRGEKIPVLWSHADSTADVPSGELPGGSGRFEVLVSDGIHCATRTTELLTLADKDPVIEIVSPEEGLRIEYSQLVRFTVEAWDPNRDTIADISWAVGERSLGEGSSITVDDLPVGTNIVEVSVRNAAGRTASDTVAVVVHDDLSVPPATLAVAPTSISWAVDPQTGQTETRILEVSNTGGGSVAFAVSESAPWLSIDLAGGQAPASIQLSANAAGLPEGTSLSTIVTVVKTNGEAQTIEIPVSLLVGSQFLDGGDPIESGDPGNFRRGDANGSSMADISDAIFLLAFLFTGGDGPACFDAADVNDDGSVDISDPTAALGFFFLGAAPPPAPGPEVCGPDPTADDLPECSFCP